VAPDLVVLIIGGRVSTLQRIQSRIARAGLANVSPGLDSHLDPDFLALVHGLLAKWMLCRYSKHLRPA
jgi:hypothetical protein